MPGTEKRGPSLVVWRYDGEQADVEKNSSNSGADRSSSAYILDTIEHSVYLPCFQNFYCTHRSTFEVSSLLGSYVIKTSK
jgi:hypothetical protein